MRIDTPRYVIRDFTEDDRQAFVAYQSDARYRALYDAPSLNEDHAHGLFDQFSGWREQRPRVNLQVGAFERANENLYACVGLRRDGQPSGTAAFGLELAPDYWGRFGAAIEIAHAVVEYGFDALQLNTLVGSTASGNIRVERLARWFGATLIADRDGPAWMHARNWKEVDWALTREAWRNAPARRRFITAT